MNVTATNTRPATVARMPVKELHKQQHDAPSPTLRPSGQPSTKTLDELLLMAGIATDPEVAAFMGARVSAHVTDATTSPATGLNFTLADVPELDPDPTQRTRGYQPNAKKCNTGVAVRNQANRQNELLSAALAYAAKGIYVMPLHEPLFDANGKCCGCTCEAWKRSKKYFEWLRSKGLEKKFDPNYTCRTPGKHPRITDWETNASNDPDQIRAWWHKWPTANLGMAVGKSGLVTFDRDTYKEIYGDDSDLFTPADKETPTQISQNGGEHVVYKMPEDKAYTNANNTLPPGVDIRGVGGMQVVEPSIGPSGKQWEWEEGYSILERDPLPLPAKLAAILDAAQAKSTPAKAVTFSAVTSEKPELLRWRTSKEVRALINAPGTGDRSENDMSVCVSLVYAGATDDEILAVFQHYPIGTDGKYAEDGDRYLALTIGKARAYVELHPRPDISATVANLLLYVRTHSFEDKVKPEFLASDGTYRTNSTDTKVADAVLCEMKERQRLTVNIGKKRLAKLAGLGSGNTALKALNRLHGVLFDVAIDPLHGAQVALFDAPRLQQIDPLLARATVYKRGQSSANDVSTAEINEYSPRKADEPFLTGTSRYVKSQIKNIAATLSIPPNEAKADYTFASLGESGLRVIDALSRAGDMTAKELSEETGKKMSSIRTAVRKLVQHGILHAERACVLESYTYSLCDDVWGKLAEVAPTLRTYTTAAQRENKRLESAQQWAQKGIGEAKAAQDTEQAQRLERRYEKLGAQRVPHLARLHPDLSKDDIKRLAYEVADYKRSPQTEQAIRTERTEATAEHRADVRMIRELAIEFSELDTPTEEIFNKIMQFGTFDKNMVASVLQSPRQMADYETVEDVRSRLPKVKPSPKTYYGHLAVTA